MYVGMGFIPAGASTVIAEGERLAQAKADCESAGGVWNASFQACESAASGGGGTPLPVLSASQGATRASLTFAGVLVAGVLVAGGAYLFSQRR